MLRRMLVTERTRLLVLSGAMMLWFVLLLAVYNETGPEIFAAKDLGSIGKAFDIRTFVQPDFVLGQLVATGTTHPLFLLMMASIVIALGARSCAGELDAGTLELTLARPISRTRYLLGYWLFQTLAAAWLLAIGAAGAIVIERLMGIEGTLHADRMAATFFNAWLMFVALGTLALLISTLVRSRGSALFASIVLVVAMYFVTFFARVWSAIEPVGKLSMFDYFPATDLMIGASLDAIDVLVLVGVTVVALAAALWQFERRDLV